ncbi:MAG: hypothetical protein H0X37_05630 [Herpetosiphonaceae bacterium]|nr:hypothetical protein [Herpetosiphonaceae bacterium]
METCRLDQLLSAAQLLILLGEVEHAQQAIEALGLLAPHASSFLLVRAMLAQAQGETAGAIKAFRLAAGRDPLESEAWQGLATLLPAGAEQAMAAERAALLQDAAVTDLRRGKPYLALGRLTILVERHPQWHEWTILRAEALRRLNAPEQAHTLLLPLLDEVPVPVPALWLMAALVVHRGDLIRLIKQAVASDPGGLSAKRCFAPDQPPFLLPELPEVPIPASLARRVHDLQDMLPAYPWAEGPRSMKPLRLRAAKGPTGIQLRSRTQSDQASAVALAEVERATQRLLGATPPSLGDGHGAALLVTHRGNLAVQMPYDVERVLQLLQNWAAALTARDVEAHVVVVDDPQPLPVFGDVAAVVQPSPEAITELLRAVHARLTAKGQHLDAIMLIGGDAIIPFHQLPNPTTDADLHVLSDNPYGCAGDSYLIPDVVVARMPDDSKTGGHLLVELLQRSVDFHHGWLSPRSPATFFPLLRLRRGTIPPGSPIQGWAASTLAWQLPSQTVYNALKSTEPLVLCPPPVPSSATTSWNAQRLLYFNLHGLPGGANWYGQAADAPPNEPLPVALTPRDVVPLHPNAICVSEACYGAEIAGRSTQDALALRLLASNALAFVGSTATSYGSIGLPLGGADVLVNHLLANLRRGHPVGRALLLARDGLARSAALGQGYLDPDDAKTLLSFVLLGDPWATPYARPVVAAKAALPALSAPLVRRQPVPLGLLPGQSLAVARRLISKFVPYLQEASLVADGQGRSNRSAKGGPGDTLVFSAQRSFITADGQSGSHVARLTLSDDTLRKLLITR